MKKDVFIGDLLEQVGELSTVESYNFRFKNYKIIDIEGKKFIVGTGVPENLDSPLSGIPFDDPELLFSLIKLVKGPLPNYFDGKHMNEVVSDEDILSWCEKYGIPYEDKELNRIKGDQLFRPEYLYLNHFKYKLARLYAQFYLWKGLVEEDPEKIQRYKFAIRNRVEINKMLHKSRKEENEIKLIKEGLSSVVNEGIRVNMSLFFDLKKESYTFKLRAQTLFDIAYYHFASLMTKEPSDNKKKLKHCSSCNSLFWANHGRSKYCNNCDRRTVWSRKKAQKK